MSMIQVFLFLFSGSPFLTQSVQASNSWGGTCAIGTWQSPIKLNRSEANETQFPSLKFHGIDAQFYPELENTGYGVQMLVPRNVIKLSSGNLWDEYVLYNVQWHWNRCEHYIDERSCILETHLMFRNARYYTREHAQYKADGFVVLAVLHEPAYGTTNYLSKIHEVIWHVTEVKATIVAPHHITIRDMLPSDLEIYYTYKGSFTSPPCFQAVTWIVFTDFLQATYDDIYIFRTVRGNDGNPVHHNYRDLQPINGRDIYFNNNQTRAFCPQHMTRENQFVDCPYKSYSSRIRDSKEMKIITFSLVVFECSAAG